MAASKGTVSGVPVKDLKMIVVGEIEVDKSSSGNALLGGEVFRVESNLSSGTIKCSEQSDTVVTVVNTPGISYTDQRNDAVKKAIKTYHATRNKEPNTVLFVMEPGFFVREDKEAVKKVEDVFGKDVWDRAVNSHTLGDKADKKVYEKLKLDIKDQVYHEIHVAGHKLNR